MQSRKKAVHDGRTVMAGGSPIFWDGQNIIQTVSRRARPTAGFDKQKIYGVYAFRGKN